MSDIPSFTKEHFTLALGSGGFRFGSAGAAGFPPMSGQSRSPAEPLTMQSSRKGEKGTEVSWVDGAGDQDPEPCC